MSWGPTRPASDAQVAAALAAPADALPVDALAKAWAGQSDFVLLCTGFGLGHGLLALWQAWRSDPVRCGRLLVIAIAQRPPTRAQLASAHAGSPCPALLAELLHAWPPLTPDLHPLALDRGALRLLLAVGPVDRVLRDLVAGVDAVLVAPGLGEPGPLPADWDRHRWRRLARLARPGARLFGPALLGADAAALRSAGFVPEPFDARSATPAPPANISLLARFAPAVPARPPPGRQALAREDLAAPRQVAVVGAGLAGAAVARALAALGVVVTVFDRQPGPAQETSGNAGGLFHGLVHGQDSHHARWFRAAALHTQRQLQPLLASGQVAGAAAGLLRGEHGLHAAAMQALLQQQGLPADYVRVVPDAWPDHTPAWCFSGGGWLAPASLCAAWLSAPGITQRMGCEVSGLRPAHGRWHVVGGPAGAGQVLAEVDAVVLCNAADAQRLLASLPPQAAASTGWPLQRQRGQTTELPADLPGLPRLPLPLADAGYALTLADGRLLCGGSSQADDSMRQARSDDHARHLAILRRLTGWTGELDMNRLQGRVGWRLHTPDRLPLLGPVPAAVPALVANAQPPGQAPPQAPDQAPDQPRRVPRLPGLYLFTALGSRGITQAALGGEVLAAWLCGTPVPVPAPLLDAVDPARFIARAARQPRPARG